MSDQDITQRSAGDLLVGGGLILLGILFLLDAFFDLDFGDFLWPLFIIGPGILIFLFSLRMDGKSGSGTAVFGAIITMVGAILLFQNTFDAFETWAYAWALIAPTSIGLGQVFYGSIKGMPELVESGRDLTFKGVGLFAVFAFFFEVIIGLSGFLSGYRQYLLPFALIALGVYLLFRRRQAEDEVVFEAEEVDMEESVVDPEE